MGSVVLPHLRTGWHVDQAILSEEDRLVVIRFGRDHDPDCMRQDEMLYKIADKVKNFAVRHPHLPFPLPLLFLFHTRPLPSPSTKSRAGKWRYADITKPGYLSVRLG